MAINISPRRMAPPPPPDRLEPSGREKRRYADYLKEHVDRNISYAEYVAESINIQKSDDMKSMIKKFDDFVSEDRKVETPKTAVEVLIEQHTIETAGKKVVFNIENISNDRIL